MLTDIEIAQKARMQRITQLAKEKLGIDEEYLEPYGHYKAKLSLEFVDSLAKKPDGKLILVTAISPTPAGEGKTTTTVGLCDALNRIGKKTVLCIREPSLGPVFGIKGGAAGGGYAQVVPMEDINLHFTGDFNAVGLANNLLAAAIDNHIHHGNALGLDARRITWRRVVDMNDRALREVVISLGGPANGYPRQDGFDITVASEAMAIFCLATSLKDLKNRLGNIVVGYTREQKPVRARELNVDGAMTVLLKDALKPNLVQTLENNPAFIHGGPFANIAHGCNSVIATKTAVKLADYVVTEAGFGADLGAEKFIDIKCRKAGLRPSAVVLVATLRALKYHGGVDLKELNKENLPALEKGIANLERHVSNVRNHFGLPCIVSINHFTFDTDAEIDLLRKKMAGSQAPVVVARHWSEGGKGAEELARTVVGIVDKTPAGCKFVYEESAPLWDKMKAIATKIYGAADIVADAKVRAQIQRLQNDGYGHYPVCVAKTQYSFSTDPGLRGAPGGHVINVREVRLSAGAEFVVMICGDIMTMPGLPKVPAAEKINI
ncbi:MAG TPA: formate--tetrahydrofolate ligase, partial [Burkholderiales bacterium]|nr:formate--tetrahydrofolate ligase [Burkholderiales bacterium]